MLFMLGQKLLRDVTTGLLQYSISPIVPNPAEWGEYEPTSVDGGDGNWYHIMTSEVGETTPGVIEYWFECTDNNDESGWHSEQWEDEFGNLLEPYEIVFLAPGEDDHRSYRCKMRDSITHYETGWSEVLETYPY